LAHESPPQVSTRYFDFRWIDESGKGLADLNDPKQEKRFMAVRLLETWPVAADSRGGLQVWFPHGIIPLGGFLAASEFDSRMPGYFGRMAVAPALLHVPFLRTVFGSFGAMPNDKRSMVRALEREKHLALFPGGIAELFLSSRAQEHLYLKKRKGFVKLALQTGANIIPIYVFGHTHMFDQLSNVPTVAALSRFFRASVTFFWGRWYLPLPYRTPVTFIRGRPIEVREPIANPTEQQVGASVVPPSHSPTPLRHRSTSCTAKWWKLFRSFARSGFACRLPLICVPWFPATLRELQA
jgi:hypothetical protein